ncbi:TonB-dependent receptor [Flavobacteriaceae bacterium]|nr:TonB-dependent receptor [Flavobacteriaceae bacterium]MDB3874538.1 TonB-dependent receptor [Flavobacteriaceae bacterium]MDC0879235.1 TonB-dependent receptor [Flavobacteriaceae bacterium]
MNRLIIPLVFFSTLSFAQQITVKDENTNENLPDVVIFNESKSQSIITDLDGVVDLSLFSSDENIFFQLLGYSTLEILKIEVLNGTIIYLQSESQNLEEVILSVARSESNVNQIAEKVSVIKSEDLFLSSPASGAELLELSPGVRVQKSQGGGGSPIIRGFEANRVLIVVDGVRMNNAIYRSGHLQNSITIDPNNIERAEVIFGSSSVGYGSDALGGVIHYYTKSPILKGSEKIKSSFTSNYTSANQGLSNNFITNYSSENWGSITSLSISKFGDIKMGETRDHGFDEWGLTPLYSENSRYSYYSQPSTNSNENVQKNTGYSQVDLFQKFLIKLGDTNLLNINIQFSESSDIDRFDQLSITKGNSLKFSEWYYGPQKRLLISPSLKIFPNRKFMKKGVITFGFQKINESRIKRRFNALNRSHQIEDLQVFSLNGDFDTSLNDTHSISYGVESTYNYNYSKAYDQIIEIQGDKITGLSKKFAIPTRYPSNGSSYTSFASYVNWSWNMSEFFTFNIGTRLTFTGLKASWNDIISVNPQLSEVTLNSEALTSTVSIKLRPSKRVQINTVLSSGFRNPNIDDIGKIRENNGLLVVPNTFLKPEYAYNLDLGIDFRSLNNRNYISLRGFSTIISRHIGRDEYVVYSDITTPDLSTVIYNGEEVTTISNKNLGNRFIHGFSIDGFSQINNNLKFDYGITYTEGDKNETYGPLPSISPLFGSIALSYSKRGLNLKAMYKFSEAKSPGEYSFGGEDGLDETPFTINSEGLLNYLGTPKWSDLSIYGSKNISSTVTLRIGLTNVFDTHYRTFASGISAPGRSFQLGLNLKL